MLLAADDWGDVHVVEVRGAHGAALARVPVSGTYLINISENHPEMHSPYAGWRRRLTERVNEEGSRRRFLAAVDADRGELLPRAVPAGRIKLAVRRSDCRWL
jgi:hypothetical protein